MTYHREKPGQLVRIESARGGICDMSWDLVRKGHLLCDTMVQHCA